jgi:ribonuclease HII
MKKQEFLIGVDDAGRGPVIGPMVIAGILTDDAGASLFKKLNVKDSKLVLPGTREKLAKEIKKISMANEIVKILPEEIDSAVNSPGFNLNKLEASKMGYVINQLADKLPKDAKITVYVDCPSNNIPAWRNVLLGFIERKEMNFKVEHKCDLNHVECSAASILAKVTRDEEIEKIKKFINVDFGSGYPSDPITVEFLKKNLKKYSDSGIFRKSWQTFKNHDHSSGKKQKNLEDF